MALIIGSRNTSGDGSTIKAAAANERLRLGDFIQLQLTESTGPVTAVLKLGSTTVYSVLLATQGSGVALRLPEIIGQRGDDLFLNLSDNKAVGYTIDVDVLTTY